VVAGQKLTQSPVVRVWNRDVTAEFEGRNGLWVTCCERVAQVISGFGSPGELIGLPGDVEQYEQAQFFVVPSDLVDQVDVACELTVTCMN